MPGLSQMVGDLWNRQLFVASTVPATYTNAAHTVLNITGGLALILAIIEYCDLALTGATQTRVAVNGNNMDAGAVAINAGGAQALVLSPLGNQAKEASDVAVEWPQIAAITAEAGRGILAGPTPGTIIWTFSVVAMNAADRVSLHVLYRKIHPQALIA